MGKTKHLKFGDLAFGSSFMHGVGVYVKVSKSMAVPVFRMSTIKDVEKVRFRKDKEVEIFQKIDVKGRDGSRIQLYF